jgi:hypothetical protein
MTSVLIVDDDVGLRTTIQWARLHASAAGTISPRRCVVLADDGDRGWRLWQIVHAEPALREAIERALREPSGEAVVAASLRERALDVDHVLARLPGAAQTEGIVPAIAALLRA